MPSSDTSKIAERKAQELATHTQSKYAEIYNPKYMHKAEILKPMYHPAQALQLTGVPVLAQMTKTIGKVKVAAIIKLHLIQLNELLGLNKPLTEIQIDTIADTMLERYYNISVVDIHIIHKRIVSGDYGELFERLNPPKYLKWVDSYFDERCEAGAQLSIKKQGEHKAHLQGLNERSTPLSFAQKMKKPARVRGDNPTPKGVFWARVRKAGQ